MVDHYKIKPSKRIKNAFRRSGTELTPQALASPPEWAVQGVGPQQAKVR